MKFTIVTLFYIPDMFACHGSYCSVYFSKVYTCCVCQLVVLKKIDDDDDTHFVIKRN